MGSAPWAIVDFPGPDGQPDRQVFRDPVEVLTTRDLAEVIETLDRVQTLASSGHHLVGFVAYDAAPAFDPAFVVRPGYEGPLVWFAGFTGPSAGPVDDSGAPVE